MAYLYERFFPVDDSIERLPVHAFVAMLAEYARGKKTEEDIINTFTLDTETQSDLSVMISDIDAYSVDGDKMLYIRGIRDVLYLAEIGTAYNTQTEFNDRLGL